jgi:hypothetical protein
MVRDLIHWELTHNQGLRTLKIKLKPMTVTEVFGDIAGSLAQMAPEKVVALKAPPYLSERVEALTERKKRGTLSEGEAIELERYLSLDLLINLAKARANNILGT